MSKNLSPKIQVSDFWLLWIMLLWTFVYKSLCAQELFNSLTFPSTLFFWIVLWDLLGSRIESLLHWQVDLFLPLSHQGSPISPLLLLPLPRVLNIDLRWWVSFDHLGEDVSQGWWHNKMDITGFLDDHMKQSCLWPPWTPTPTSRLLSFGGKKICFAFECLVWRGGQGGALCYSS